tara:strand:- start:5760 stop:7175 length:1416 start_codon:yes stop_codon:yes gene_type:complete
MAVSTSNSLSLRAVINGFEFAGVYEDVTTFSQFITTITASNDNIEDVTEYTLTFLQSNDGVTAVLTNNYLGQNASNHSYYVNPSCRYVKIQVNTLSSIDQFEIFSVVKNTNLIQNTTNTNFNSFRNVVNVNVGDWYSIKSLGDTTTGSWDAMGAVVGDEVEPVVGRVFLCLSAGAGSGDVYDIASSTNVIVSNIPEVTITNTGFTSNIIASITLPINNTLENALYVQADANIPVNIQASIDLDVKNTLANALYVQADANIPVNIQASIDLDVKNTLANALYIQADTSHPVFVAIPSGAVIDASITECIDLQVKNTLANSLYIQADTSHPIYAVINTLPSIAITNTGFNSNITNAFLTVKNKPTYSVSLFSAGTTSQNIRSSAGVLHTVVISSIPTGTTFDYLKFYNSSSATEASTPLMTIPIKAGESLTFVADMNFSAGLCVRATDAYSSASTDAPISIINITVFITGYSE